MNYKFELKGYVNAKVLARGPILYFMRDFDKNYEIYSIYWKIHYKGVNFLIDTGINDLDYINSTVRGGFKWEIINKVKKFSDIDYIFPTHLHFDHSSGIYEYKDAKILINEKTYKNIFKNKFKVLYNDRIYKREILENVKSKNNIMLLRDGQEIVEGVKTFWIGGHSPCSQMIEFFLDFKNFKQEKILLFPGDVISTYRNINEKIPGGFNYNLMDYFFFFKKFSSDKYLIIPGHDIEAYNLYSDLKY